MKPILFKSEMVRAILDGRKTVTRRVVKPQPKENEENPHRIASGSIYFDVPDKTFGGILKSVGPYRPTYRPGDILYVRETFCRQHRGPHQRHSRRVGFRRKYRDYQGAKLHRDQDLHRHGNQGGGGGVSRG